MVGGENGGSWTGMSRQLRALAWPPFLRQRLTMFVAKQRSSDLDQLARLLVAGTVTPCLERTYALDGAADAMRHLEAGKARGKVALTP
jgi:NADPH:quinone reductase-like Zn-dependent oxidoreductase